MRQVAPAVWPGLVMRLHSLFCSSVYSLAGALAVSHGLDCLSACGDGHKPFVLPPVAPSILQQPANQTVTVGQTASFTVTARGTAPMTYQWAKGGTVISGAMSSTYTTAVTVMEDSGTVFTVTITNAQGTVTSAPATLTVNSTTPVASSLVPSSAAPPYNSSVRLVPTFSGGTAVIGSSGAGSSDITVSAVSGASYATPALTQATTYTLTVTSPGGDVASTVTVVTPSTITVSSISPANQIMAPGQQAFSATASGGITNQLTWTADVKKNLRAPRPRRRSAKGAEKNLEPAKSAKKSRHPGKSSSLNS